MKGLVVNKDIGVLFIRRHAAGFATYFFNIHFKRFPVPFTGKPHQPAVPVYSRRTTA